MALEHDEVCVRRLGDSGPLLGADGFVVSLITFDSAAFADVLALREGMSSGPPTDPADAHSYHYCLYCGAKALAAYRVTRLIDAPFEEFENLPPTGKNLLPNETASSSRLVVREREPRAVVSTLFRIALRHQWLLGARLDVINVRSQLIRYYLRLGYILLDWPSFVHGRSGKEHYWMLAVPGYDLRKPMARWMEGLITDRDRTWSASVMQSLSDHATPRTAISQSDSAGQSDPDDSPVVGSARA